MLAGDKAYDLFISSELFPLHDFLEEWKSGKIEAAPSYVLAVIYAYDRMSRTHAGPRDGTYCPVVRIN